MAVDTREVFDSYGNLVMSWFAIANLWPWVAASIPEKCSCCNCYYPWERNPFYTPVVLSLCVLLSLFLWVSFFVIFPCFTSELLMFFFFFSNYSQNPWILPSWDTHQNWPVFCLCHWPYFSGHPEDLQCWFWSTHGSLVLFQVNPLFMHHDTALWSLFFVVAAAVVIIVVISCVVFFTLHGPYVFNYCVFLPPFSNYLVFFCI